MSYIILSIGILCTLISYIRYRTVLICVILYTCISPSITIGNMKFDSIYLYIISLFLIIISIGEHKIRINRTSINYLLYLLFISFIYIIAWTIVSRIDFRQLIISIAGVLKLSIIIILVYSLDIMMTKKSMLNRIAKSISLLALLNFVAIIFQKYFPIYAYNLFSNLYSSESASYYLQTSVWGQGSFFNGRYIRYFGLFENPMILGCFSAVSIIFLFIYMNDKNIYKNKFKIGVIILILFYNGIMSSTKTFYFIIPIAISLIFLTSKISLKRKIITISFIFTFFIFIIFNFESISKILYSINPGTAYSFSFLKNPMDALITRYGTNESTGFLTDTLKIAKEYFILGVGPVSNNGEFIGDSSYVVLFHNGGIVAILVTIVYYITNITKLIKNKAKYAWILMLIIMILGIGQNCLIGYNSVLFVHLIFLSDLSLSNRKRGKYELKIL